MALKGNIKLGEDASKAKAVGKIASPLNKYDEVMKVTWDSPTKINSQLNATYVGSPAKGTTEVAIKHGTEVKKLLKDEEEIVHPGIFNKQKTGCSITVRGGRTHNLGNYNSMQLNVSITIPCDPEVLEGCYDWAYEWVSNKIEKEFNKALGEV